MKKLLIVACVCIGACSEIPKRDIDVKEVVMKRASQRWATALSGNVVDAYQFLPPSQRRTRSLNSFLTSAGNSMKYEFGNPVSVVCDHSDRCIVKVNVGAKIPVPGFSNQIISTDVDEIWIFEDGEWWLYQK